MTDRKMTEPEQIKVELDRILQRVMLIKPGLPDATRLHHDLSIAGDDACEIFKQIHKVFGTDLVGFVFTDYFPEETDALWCRISSAFGFKSKKKVLTLGHLIKVVQEGRWTDPVV